MKKNRNFLIWTLFIFLILILIIFLPSSGLFIQAFFRKDFCSYDEKINSIIAENQALKAKLAEIESSLANVDSFNLKTKKVAVYSFYPFSFKGELLIAGGKDMNLKEGSGVFLEGKVLIGRVEKVWAKKSLVRTIFDPRWQSAVRIGPSGIGALLKGGDTPYLSLIEKEAKVSSGEIVYNADSRYPYGAPHGELDEISFDKNFVFKEANLKTKYDLKKAKFVFVLSEDE